MTRTGFAHLVLAALLGLAASTHASAEAPSPLDDSERERPSAKQCVEIRSEAVYRGYGYSHLVHLHNSCETRMTCKVSTDVNPEATVLTLAKGEKQTVTTFNGSPSSEFTAKVDCAEAK